MSPRWTLALLAMLAVAPLNARADVPPAQKPPRCASAAYRQFDFWLGDWNVKDATGKDVGQNRLVLLHAGCVLQESWAGTGNVSGSSLSGYDAAHDRWHQTWMDSSGGVLQLDGRLEGANMVLDGDTLDPATRAVTRNRVTWMPLADGRVRQWWQQSDDGGKTWTTAFDGYYTRK